MYRLAIIVENTKVCAAFDYIVVELELAIAAVHLLCTFMVKAAG